MPRLSQQHQPADPRRNQGGGGVVRTCKHLKVGSTLTKDTGLPLTPTYPTTTPTPTPTPTPSPTPSPTP